MNSKSLYKNALSFKYTKIKTAADIGFLDQTFEIIRQMTFSVAAYFCDVCGWFKLSNE